MEILWKGTASAQFRANCPKICGNRAFPQKFPHQEIRWNDGILHSVWKNKLIKTPFLEHKFLELPIDTILPVENLQAPDFLPHYFRSKILYLFSQFFLCSYIFCFRKFENKSLCIQGKKIQTPFLPHIQTCFCLKTTWEFCIELWPI